MKKAIMLLVLCSAVPATLHAQTVWRCGGDGRTFTDAPCPQGQAMDVATPRPVADLHQAQQLAQREKAWADQLQRERLQREAQQAAGPAGIYGLRPVKSKSDLKPKPAKKHPKHRLEAAETWTAVAPSTRRKKG